MRLDPVQLEILNNKVAAIADEMTLALKRASRSIFVKEAADFGTALTDRAGHVFAYPNANSVSSIDRICGPSIRAVGELEEGDVIVTNDPYLSEGLATHLPDLHMIAPFFHRGRIVCYGWAFIHFMDVGGRVPSSISPSNSEIFQEGLRIPPMKVTRRGRINSDFAALFAANCRTPDQNLADLRAMLGALATGGKRISALIERHGIDTFLACQTDLQDYTADKARRVLRLLPDGVYEFWDYMDDDMVSCVPLRFRVRLTVDDGQVNVDVSHTDPQVEAAYNVPTMGKRHPWLLMRLITFMLTHDKTMPINVGLYRHITVTNPPGTVLNAEFPDAVGIRQAAARRLSDAITGAILKAAPDLMAAPTCGSLAPLVLAERRSDGGRSVTVIEPLMGGMGASPGRDGVDGRDSSMSNLNNHPLETVEADAEIVLRKYDIRPDSGGAGRWRGGNGLVITFEVLRDGGIVMARGMERLRFPSWGVGGAKPAKPFRAMFNMDRPGERQLGKIDALAVNAGDTVTLMTPGAGGFGDAFERPAEEVLEDVELGFVSPEAALSDYGVVIVDGRIDAAATTGLRARRVRDNLRTDFDFGPEREAWEAVFDDETMCDLNRQLYGLPKSVRQERRRWIFSQAVPDLPRAGGKPLTDVLTDVDATRRRLTRAMEAAFGGAGEKTATHEKRAR